MGDIILTQIPAVYVRTLYHHLNVTYSFLYQCRLSNSSTKSSKSIFQLVLFSLKYISVTQSFTSHGISGKCFL